MATASQGMAVPLSASLSSASSANHTLSGPTSPSVQKPQARAAGSEPLGVMTVILSTAMAATGQEWWKTGGVAINKAWN